MIEGMGRNEGKEWMGRMEVNREGGMGKWKKGRKGKEGRRAGKR